MVILILLLVWPQWSSDRQWSSTGLKLSRRHLCGYSYLPWSSPSCRLLGLNAVDDRTIYADNRSCTNVMMKRNICCTLHLNVHSVPCVFHKCWDCIGCNACFTGYVFSWGSQPLKVQGHHHFQRDSPSLMHFSIFCFSTLKYFKYKTLFFSPMSLILFIYCETLKLADAWQKLHITLQWTPIITWIWS